MKKLLLLVLVAWGLGYMVQSLKRAQQRLQERNANLQRRAVEVPKLAQPERLTEGSDWMRRERQRLQQVTADKQRRATWERQFGAKCAAARASLSAIQLTERAPGSFTLQRYTMVEGSRRRKVVPVSETERAAARAETEKFIAENCHP